MADKKKKAKKDNEITVSENNGKTTSDYYKLKTDAVDRLINADADTAPEVSEKEIEKYTGHKKFKIPEIVKVIFVKFWFAGATCFFFIFGLGTYIQANLDLLFVSGLALGAIKDLLENNLLRFFEKREGNSKKYMLVEYKQFWALFLDAAYGIVLMLITAYIYNLIALIVAAVAGAEKAATIGIEPLSFGLIVMLLDFLFIGIKNTIKKIIKDAKKTVAGSADH